MRGLALALVIVPAVVLADVVSPAPDAVRVTIYRGPRSDVTPYAYEERYDFDYAGASGLVMVSETRTVEIPAGTSVVVFRGVADAIVPQRYLTEIW